MKPAVPDTCTRSYICSGLFSASTTTAKPGVSVKLVATWLVIMRCPRKPAEKRWKPERLHYDYLRPYTSFAQRRLSGARKEGRKAWLVVVVVEVVVTRPTTSKSPIIRPTHHVVLGRPSTTQQNVRRAVHSRWLHYEMRMIRVAAPLPFLPAPPPPPPCVDNPPPSSLSLSVICIDNYLFRYSRK